MDAPCFDRLTRALAAPASRQRLLRGLAILGLVAGPVSDVGTAKKRKKKVEFNEFNCVNVGNFCKHDDQCCSGICQGKKGKRKCRAHDGGSGCQAGQAEGCAGDLGNCISSTGLQGSCDTTTGNAGYCGLGFRCADCSKDVECQDLCGLAAAVCIKCPDCAGPGTLQTACVIPISLGVDDCM